MRSIREYHRPQQLEEALALLARHDVTTLPIGGGTGLVAEGRLNVEAIVDLRDLGLSYIRRDGAALRLGATTTLQTLIDSPESAQAWSGELARVLELTVARNLREAGTIAGTLVSATNNNPLAVLLLALDASLTIEPGRKTVALEAFLSQRASLLTASLITEVTVPLPRPGQAVAFEKVGRTPADLPIVCAAIRAQLENGVLRDVRIGLGGVAPLPVRASRIEQALQGKPPDAHAVERARADLNPPSDFLGSAEYRREVAAVLVRRAIERLMH
ncbi:MAG TPA: FAD binding domain-containing protein [Anaerolineae bacterium]